MMHRTPPISVSPPPPPQKSSKFLLFLRSELKTPPDPAPSDDDDIPDAQVFAARRREKVYTFVSIPRELEKLMGYGFFQCADAFLYVFTFLPLRCLLAGYEYAKGYLTCRNATLRPSDKCELLKTLILVICCWLFMYIDTNVLYHVIKSQSVIKLYIFFNMLEVGDRLFGCFSQDTLDALFITATEQDSGGSQRSSTPTCTSPTQQDSKSRTRTIKKLSTTTHAVICGVSILGHALVILLQSTTLSVAINANNRALLTVMMSNNFVELKGSVFKKFDKMNLFQVSCSDIRERFHLFVLLLIVCLQTLREYSWEESRFWVLLPDCLMVLLAEIGVDWIKHAFITRFNELPLQVYEHYTRSLAYDMAESVKRKQSASGGSSGFSEYSDVVGRRLGFVPLPLAIVLIRVVSPMWRVNDQLVGLIVLSFLGYVALATFRILNMVVLVGKAVRIMDEHCAREEHTTTTSNQTASDTFDPTVVKNSILKRTRTISGSDGDLLNRLKVDKKLKFEEDSGKVADGSDPSTAGGLLGRNYLFANSNVSLYSVGFNEEMMKVEKEMMMAPPPPLPPPHLSERKHSLGSNLYEGVLLGTTTTPTTIKLEPPDSEELAADDPFCDEADTGIHMKVELSPSAGDGDSNNVVVRRDSDPARDTSSSVENTSAIDGSVASGDNSNAGNNNVASGDSNASVAKTESDSPAAVVTESSDTGSGSRPSSSKAGKRIINWFK